MKKEDSDAAAQCLSLAIQKHNKQFPKHTKFISDTDAAGAFAGIGFLGRIRYLRNVIGVESIEHSIGDSRSGKAHLMQDSER
jgi:hypothetical protein